MVEDALIRLENLKTLGHKPADLVRLVGKTYPYWRDLLAGQKSFGEKAARNIEEKLGLPRGCLDQVDGCKPGALVAREPAPSYSPTPGLPVVGTAKLGDDGLFYELQHPVGHGDGRIDWPSRDPNAYAVRCRGESMKPRIRSGEYVIVEPNHPVNPGDEVLVKARDGRVMVKEFAYVRDGAVYLDSVNEAHPKISIPQDQVEVMHYVAGIAKAALWRSEEDAAAPTSQHAAEQYRALVAKPLAKPAAKQRKKG